MLDSLYLPHVLPALWYNTNYGASITADTVMERFEVTNCPAECSIYPPLTVLKGSVAVTVWSDTVSDSHHVCF